MSHLQDFEIIKQFWILDKDSLSKYKMYLSDICNALKKKKAIQTYLSLCEKNYCFLN